MFFFFFSSRRRHTSWNCDWSSDVCSSDLIEPDAERFLRQPLSQRGLRGEPGRELGGGRSELIVWHYFVDHTDSLGLRRADDVAAQDQLISARQPHQPRKN